MNRRNFIRIASGGVILAAGGIAAGSFVATRNPHAALLPWNTSATQYSDPIRRALSYAILAPSPHNRQPWVIDLEGNTAATLYCDLDRLLPSTDPFSRQIVIGLGCFLESFSIAASADGYRADINLFPEGEPGTQLSRYAIARLRLISDPGRVRDPLFNQVLHRRTNRNTYDTTRPIAATDIALIGQAAGSGVIAGSSHGGAKLSQLRELTRVALRGEIMDEEAFAESIDLMRIGRKEIEANPDGIYLGGAFLESLALAGLLSREEMADPGSQSFQIGLNMADEQALTSMGFVWINTRGNSRRQQIEAGRSYFRVALTVAALGLSMQPMSQALQEYTAMRPYYEQVHNMLTDSPEERIQMLARLGYAVPVDAAPRWTLATRIRRS